MYKIKSIKTGKESILTSEQWQKMVQRGDSVKFTASPIKATEAKVPAEVAAKTAKKEKPAAVVEEPAETNNEQNGEATAMPADNSEDDII
jgi:hypothetical protein